jgi:hypothetical protein
MEEVGAATRVGLPDGLSAHDLVSTDDGRRSRLRRPYSETAYLFQREKNSDGLSCPSGGDPVMGLAHIDAAEDCMA